MAAIYSTEPVRPFWDRTTVFYACCGLVCYLLSLALDSVGSLVFLGLASAVRLAPLLLLARRRSWLLALLTPYPYAFVTAAYDARLDWLPEEWAYFMSGPTSFIVFNGGWMLASLLWTSALLSKAVPREVDSQLRSLATIVFLLTAVGMGLMLPRTAALVMHYVAEPVALTGYAALAGWGLRDDTL